MDDEFYADSLATRVMLGAVLAIIAGSSKDPKALLKAVETKCVDALERGAVDHLKNSEAVRNRAIDIVRGNIAQTNPRGR